MLGGFIKSSSMLMLDCLCLKRLKKYEVGFSPCSYHLIFDLMASEVSFLCSSLARIFFK